ncbi:hypothetical protein QYE76_032970 [Lolium multiflorum]|uniref:DUF4216 domain-containing protein n=1 Tax=Lolium multiflorum TaxID=4521 RepID=A0AAD8QWP6_LOLMU|nr:hypothetical protein QYE76_032970 [Lolium multiflorum]
MTGNKCKIEASIAEAVLNVEVANFTTKHYDPNIPTKHNPVLRYNAANNEEVPKLSIFVGLGGKSSGSKPYRTDLQERTLIHSYVLNTMVEVKPYIEQFKAIHWKNTHREPTPEESKQIFDKGGGFGFSSWFCNLARTDKEMKSELRKIARGFDHSLEAFNSYDVNGYRFQTHKYTTSRPNAKTINSGVVCQGDDGLHYYGRVEGIYELNYGFQKGLNPVVFKCHWFDPRRVRRDPEIGLVEVERNSVYKGEDVYILATQAFQVFYLPYACRNPTKRLHGWDVVMTVPSRNRPPPPNKDDYRRVDPSAKSVEFYQEEGLPGHFTIALPTIDDMVVDDEQEDAGMDGDNAEDEAEDVCAPEDLSLLEAFRAGIDLDADGPPPGFIDDYCSFKYEDPSQRPPRGYSNILGGLLRWYFPGIVNFPTGGCDVAWRWAHYSLAEDPMGRGTAADLVVAKFWKYFKRAEGKETACDDVLHQLARKRVTGMHYEARVQCVRDWHADRFVHMTKEDARDTLMQPWQYMQNPPQYVGNDDRCFLAMVMWWTCPQYLKKHEEGKKKRAEMRGGSHIQGSIPISLHLQNEELRTGAKPNVFAVLKKMKQRKTPDPETGSVWVNPQCETQCTSYVSKFKQKYGEEANPEAEDFDPEVAVLAGEGLKHGRLWFGDGCVDPAKVPSLRQIRRGRKSGQPEVEPRPRASDLAVERLREEMAAKEQAAQEQRAHMEQQILEYQQQQIQMMQQMQQQQQMMQQQQAQMSWLMSQTVLSTPPGSIAAPPPYSMPWMPPPPTQTPGTPVTVNNMNIIRSMNRGESSCNDDEAGGSGGGQGIIEKQQKNEKCRALCRACAHGKGLLVSLPCAHARQRGHVAPPVSLGDPGGSAAKAFAGLALRAAKISHGVARQRCLHGKGGAHGNVTARQSHARTATFCRTAKYGRGKEQAHGNGLCRAMARTATLPLPSLDLPGSLCRACAHGKAFVVRIAAFACKVPHGNVDLSP